jgi:hypothetical protein
VVFAVYEEVKMKKSILKISVLTTFAVLSLLACATLPVGFETMEEGVVRHTISGMEFPPRVSGFDRINITTYDEIGGDISVGYNQPRPSGCTITFYIYPASAGLGEHTSELKAMIESHHPGARLISESGVVHTYAGVDYTGTLVVYEYEEPRRVYVGNAIFESTAPVDSRAYLFIYGDWYMMYRMTYPRDFRSEIDVYIGSFMDRLIWP